MFAFNYICIINIIILFVNGLAYSDYSKSSNDKLLKNVTTIYLTKDYSKLSLPKIHDKEPVNITIVSKNLEIKKVDDCELTLSVRLQLAFSWIDSRVKLHQDSPMWLVDNTTNLKYTFLDSLLLKQLWLPDFDVVNLSKMEVGDGFNENRILKVYNNKRFWYEFPTTVTINCPLFDFKSYPFDNQVCVLLLGSFKYPIQQNVYMGYLIQNYKHNEKSLQYDISNIVALSFASCILSNNRYHLTGDGNMRSQEMHHSYFGIKIEMRRKIDTFIFGKFLPSLLLVSLNWFGFAMGSSNVNGRVSVHLASMFGILLIGYVLTYMIQSKQLNPIVDIQFDFYSQN